MENLDSPFHRAAESDLDRKIKAVKEQFVLELRSRVSDLPNTGIVEITHTPLSIYIYIVVLVKITPNYRIRMWYNMDNRCFAEPRFESHFGASEGIATFGRKSQAKNIVLDIMSACFCVSRIPGLATRYGGDLSPSCSDQLVPDKLAAEEWDRLVLVSNDRIAKELAEKEQRRLRDAEFIANLRAGKPIKGQN